MLRRFSRFLLYAVPLALLIAGGVVHGLVTDRWVHPVEEEAIHLDLLPLSIENWDGQAIKPDLELLPEINPGAILLRRYVNRVDGSAVTLFLTTGRAGPMVAEHRPESCYPGAGFNYAMSPVNRSIPVGPDGRPQEFRVATFSKTERAAPIYLRLFWSWSATGDWQVPENPRLTFAGQRRLYKLYVIRPLTRSTEPLDGDPAVSFIQVLVPELKKVIADTSG